MNDISIIVGIIVGIFAMLSHLVVSVWWASKITTTLEIVIAIQKAYTEDFKSCVKKEELLREIKITDNNHRDVVERINIVEKRVNDFFPMRKIVSLAVFSLLLIGCAVKFEMMVDSKGNKHCREVSTGRFVDFSQCGK